MLEWKKNIFVTAVKKIATDTGNDNYEKIIDEHFPELTNEEEEAVLNELIK